MASEAPWGLKPRPPKNRSFRQERRGTICRAPVSMRCELLFRSFGSGGDGGDVGLLNERVKRGEILGLQVLPGRELRVEAPVEFRKDGARLLGGRAVGAFHGALQVGELIGNLNGVVEGVFAGLVLGLNDFF